MCALFLPLVVLLYLLAGVLNKKIMAGKKNAAKQSEQKKDDTTDTVKIDFDQLCRELNMDISTADSAWNSYNEMKHKYTLEVSFFFNLF